MNAHLGDDEKDAGSFELFVAMARGAEQLDAAELEPGQIIRMVDATLTIGFLVADADFDFVVHENSFRFQVSNFKLIDI